MKINSSLKTLPALVVAAALLVPAAQNPSPTPTPQAPSTTPTPAPRTSQQEEDGEDDVVRITTNLVQVDAVVTDKQGRQVTDLRPEDFEILEDGRAQPITNFSYIKLDAPTGRGVESTADAAPPRAADAAPILPARLRPEQVRRTIALVIDIVPFDTLNQIRRALNRFLDEQMRPDDLVAIIQIGGRAAALQQYTSDKRLLRAAIDRVRWQPSSGGGISSFAPIEASPLSDEASEPERDGGGPPEEKGGRADIERRLEEFREEKTSALTLLALNLIMRDLRELPGRKSVVLFSTGFSTFFRGDPTATNQIHDDLRRTVEFASRASVVLYTIDPRGVAYTGLRADDRPRGTVGDPRRMTSLAATRDSALFASQAPLGRLAKETGGLFISNQNDLSLGVQRIVEDQRGFYLIGYRPEASTFDPAKGRGRFHRVTVRVRREGLSVRTRSGFYGFTEADLAASRRARTPVEQISAALSSPFASEGVRLRLTALYGNDAARQPVIRLLLHMDARDFTFAQQAGDWRQSNVNIVALAIDESGAIINQAKRTETVRARGPMLRTLLNEGLVYSMEVPVKKPGAYQLRVAVRDEATQRIGSASQFIEIPDLGKGALALSGIVMMSGEQNASSTAGNAGDSLGVPAVRRFRPGAIVDYVYEIYNAKGAPGSSPRLLAAVSIFRDNQQVFSSEPRPIDTTGQADAARLPAGGRIQLGANLTPGQYAFQIVVTDALARDKRRTATQVIDFEIEGKP